MDPVIVDAPAPEAPSESTSTSGSGAERNGEPKSGWIFVRAIWDALRRVPVWLVCWFVLTALALVVTQPWFSAMDGMIGERYEHNSVIHSLFRSFEAASGGLADDSFRTDHWSELRALKSQTAHTAAIAGFLAMLWGIFTAGGWLQVALGQQGGRSVKRFFVGGARHYGRFFRLLVIVLMDISLLGWVLYGKPWNELVLDGYLGVPKSDWSALETLGSEDTVVQLAWTQAGLYALGIFAILTWARYTRTRMAMHDTKSVVWNGILTFFTMLRHPILTLRPMVVLLVVEALALWVGAKGVASLELGLDGNADFGLVLMIVLVAQALFALRIVMNGARTFAAVHASQAVVRPLMRPDPWKGSIGGPGGPRYPIEDGDDEYAISV